MNFNQLMKQAQLMQRKLDKIKKEYDTKEVEFSSSNGLVNGKINGKLEIISININEELINKENKEILEDIIMITVNNAIKEINEEREKAIDAATGGVNMPGLF